MEEGLEKSTSGSFRGLAPGPRTDVLRVSFLELACKILASGARANLGLYHARKHSNQQPLFEGEHY